MSGNRYYLGCYDCHCVYEVVTMTYLCNVLYYITCLPLYACVYVCTYVLYQRQMYGHTETKSTDACARVCRIHGSNSAGAGREPLAFHRYICACKNLHQQQQLRSVTTSRYEEPDQTRPTGAPAVWAAYIARDSSELRPRRTAASDDHPCPPPRGHTYT